MSSDAGSGRPPARHTLAWTVFLAVSILNAGVLWHFHDRYWYPTDDGLYANIAERLLSGEILNVDVQDIHPGYLHFLHVAAFRMFGIDMVSLRYPLVLAGFVQACLVYALLRRRDILLAALASLATTAFGVIQFVDPTPNWYCPLFVVALACWLAWLPPGHRARLTGAGLLLGLLTLFRQLSGVWVAMAVVVLVLLEGHDRNRERGGWLSRGLLVVMLAALVGYQILSPETGPGGVVLIAVWPMAILVWMLVNVRTGDGAAAAALAQLALGAAVSALPLALYHGVHHSFGGFINDTVLAAFGETQMPFFGHGWFGVLPLAGFYQAVSYADPAKIANGLYWTVLPLVSVANGLFILNRLHRHRQVEGLVLPILAAFYALVSLYLQGPLYLYYGVGLSLVAVLWSSAAGPRPQRIAWAAVAAGVSLVAVIFHAGQSRFRTPTEILEGHRDTATWAAGTGGLARASLRLQEDDRETYGRLVSLIQTQSGNDETILALPNDAELYFLAERRNPVRFYNSALGVRTPAELSEVMQQLRALPPRLVLFRPNDKYNTHCSSAIMDVVRTTYARIDTIDGLEIYRRH